MIPVRVEYDAEADAAYFYFVQEIRAGEAVRTVAVVPSEIGGMVNLDLDSGGRILGLEVLTRADFSDQMSCHPAE